MSSRRVASSLLVAWLLLASPASASVILSIQDDGGDGDGDRSSIVLMAGGGFALEVNLQVDGEQVVGLGFWLREATSAGFRIGGRQLLSNVFTVPSSSVSEITNAGDGIAPAGPDDRLDPQNDRDLGAISFGLAPFSGGTDLLMRLSIGTTGVALGSYTLGISPSAAGVSLEWVDPQFGFHPFDDATSTYQVTIVPEPGTAALLAAGLLGISGAGRRGRAAGRSGPCAFRRG